MNLQCKTLRGAEDEPLRLCTAGSDPLFTQVLDRTDTALSSILGLILVHRQKIDRARPPELCWDKMKFRAGLLEWIDSLGVPGLDVSAPLVS
jgi:hypothetical protein